MTMNPLKLLASAGGELLDGVRGVIDQVDTDREEELQLRNELARVERGFYETMADARAKIAEEQAKTIRAEIHSKHTLAAIWRPVLMLTFGAILVWYAVAPAFGLPTPALDQIPDQGWQFLMIGVGGYIGGRTAEKIIPNSKWGPQRSDPDEVADRVLQKIGDAGSG